MAHQGVRASWQCWGDGILKRHYHSRWEGAVDEWKVSSDGHVFLSFLVDFCLGQAEKQRGYQLGLGYQLGCIRAVRLVSMCQRHRTWFPSALTRALLKTSSHAAFRSFLFDCMTPTVGQSA
jgi:hypothetical protein